MAASQFERDAALAAANGWYPVSQVWQGTSLTVVYQYRDLAATTEARRTEAMLASVGIIIGGAVLVVAAFLPWATASAGFMSVSKAGIEGDGMLTAGLGGIIILAGLVSIRGSRLAEAVALLAAVAAIAIGVMDLNDVWDWIDTVDEALAQVGIGLWATLAGGVIAGAATLYRGLVVPRRTTGA